MSLFEYTSNPPKNKVWYLWIKDVYKFIPNKLSLVYFLWFLMQELYYIYCIPQDIFDLILHFVYNDCYLIQDKTQLESNNYQCYIDYLHHYLLTPKLHIYNPFNDLYSKISALMSTQAKKDYYRYPTNSSTRGSSVILGFCFMDESGKTIESKDLKIQDAFITCNNLILDSQIDFTNFFMYNNQKYYFDNCFLPIPIKDIPFNDIAINIKMINNKPPLYMGYLCMTSFFQLPLDEILFIKNNKNEYHLKIEQGSVNYIDGHANYGNRVVTTKYV